MGFWLVGSENRAGGVKVIGEATVSRHLGESLTEVFNERADKCILFFPPKVRVTECSCTRWKGSGDAENSGSFTLNFR